MVKERRLFVRFMMSGIVLLQKDPQNPAALDCELSDLSYDGIGLYSPEVLSVGTKVKFLFINRQLNINIGGLAKVIYAIPEKYNGKDYYRTGLEFIEVDRQQVRSILMSIRNLC